MLVDFWAPWCGPCRQLTPILEKVVRAAKGKVKLAKMNIDEHPAIPGQMGIQSIPAVIAFVNGQPADGFMGAVPESQVTAFLEQTDQGQHRRRGRGSAQGSRNLARRGRRLGRREPLCGVLADDDTNVAALAGLARCYVKTGALEQAKQTLAMVPESKRNEAAVNAAQAALDLAEQANSLGPVAELEQKVAADPLDHQARFDLALALNGKGRRHRGARAPDRDRQARPQMERRRRPQAARDSSSRPGARPTKPPSRAANGCRRFCSRSRLIFKPAKARRGRSRAECDMPMNAAYKGPADLPDVIPVFPLPGALLLPRGQMPLNIFEPRYLAMIDDALRSGQRLIGMIQPDPVHSKPDEQKPHLFSIGCVGRITQFAESGDGRYLIQLTGIARFRLEEELVVDTAYRQCRVDYWPFVGDFTPRKGEDAVDRKALLHALSRLSQGEQSQGRLGGHRERAQRGAGQCAGDDVALWRRREAGYAGSAGPQDPRRNPGRRHRDRARQEPDRRDAAAVTMPEHVRCPSPSADRAAEGVDPKLLEILVCPVTKGPLEYDAEHQELISRAAKLAYPIRDGIPIMLPEEARRID